MATEYGTIIVCPDGLKSWYIDSPMLADSQMESFFINELIPCIDSRFRTLPERDMRAITGLKVADTTAGFCCYRAEVLRTMELDKIRFKGYAFQIEMKFTAARCGFRVGEVPIIFVNRVLGTSKMSSGIFSEAFFSVIRLKIDSFSRKYPQKSK